MEMLLGIAVILAFFAFAGALMYWAHVAHKKRIEGFEKEAEAMGLKFTQQPDDSVAQRHNQFKLFNRGRRRRINNLIEGDSGDVTLLIFDYRFTTGAGKNSRTHTQTIASLKSSQLNIPSLTIHPEGFLSRIGNKMGFQDIDFDSNPTFSKMFVLKGENEEAIRSFLKPPMLEYFEAQQGIALEASGDTLFFFTPSRTIKPDEIKDLLSRAYGVFGVLTEQA